MSGLSFPRFSRLVPLAYVSLALAQGPSRLLNGPLPAVPSGDVSAHAFSNDGTRLLYLALSELWSADGGGAPVRLSFAGQSVQEFRLAPVGARVVYRACSPCKLFSVPIDGGTPAVEISGPLISGGGVQAFDIAPDGQQVVYLAVAIALAPSLFSVPITGGAVSFLNGQPNEVVHSDFRIFPDSTRVAYRVGLDLFVAELGVAGSEIALQADDVQPGFQVSADGTRVVYRSDVDSGGKLDLFGVATDGMSPAVELSAVLPTAGDVTSFAVSPTGERVVYRADQIVDERFDVYSVPEDGSAAPLRLNAPLTGQRDVTDFAVTPDGARVIYRADHDVDEDFELFSVPIGGGTTVQLDAELPDDDVLSLIVVSPDSSIVLFQNTGIGTRLYARVVDAVEPAVYLAHVASTGVQLTVSFDGALAVYDVGRSVFSVPTDGSSPQILVGAAMTDVLARSLAPDATRIAFVADVDVAGNHELFVTPADGSTDPVQISDEFPSDTVVGVIYSGQAVGDRALYVAKQESPDYVGLYEVSVRDPHYRRISGTLLPVQVATGSTVTVGAGERVVFEGASRALFSVPMDGSAEPVPLVAPSLGRTVAEHRLSPDRTEVIFLADLDEAEAFELYRVPLDGTAAPVELSGVLVPRGDVLTAFAVAPDGRVAYVADALEDELFELFASDGVAAPVRLSGTLPVDVDVQLPVRLSLDGTRVYYRTSAQGTGHFDLFAAAMDGSGAPVLISDGHDVEDDFQVTPNGARVVYRAGQMYSARSDGLNAPIRLGTNVVGFTDRFRLASGGARVVFDGGLATQPHFLYSAPTNVSQPAVRLSEDADTSESAFQITPDGASVVFVTRDTRELFRMPVDGSQAPVRLDTDQPAGLNGVLSFQFEPAGAFLLYRAGGLQHLFAVPLQPLLPPVDITPPGHPLANVADGVSVSSDAVVFRCINAPLAIHQLFGAPIRPEPKVPWPAEAPQGLRSVTAPR